MEGGDLNPQDLKHFIKESYNKDDNRVSNVGDFIYDKDLSNNKASVYYNPKTGQATITHRGTKSSSLTDWGHNLKYSLGVYSMTKKSRRSRYPIGHRGLSRSGRSRVKCVSCTVIPD